MTDAITTTEDVIVAVEGETATTDVTVDPSGEAKAKTPDPVEELKAQHAELKAQAERDRQAREAADRAAAQSRAEAERARQEAATARTESIESQFDTVASGIEAAKTESQAAEQEYKAAYEAGDAAAMAAAQRKIARAEARIVRLDEAKSYLETRKNKPETERPAPQTQTPSDPIEAFISTRTEPTAKWLREHRDFLTDQRKNAKLSAAHFSAIGEGLAADTPEYFEHVEASLGLKTKAEGKEPPRAANGQFRRSSAPPVAPVAQSGGGTSGGGTEVRLTRKEAEAAQDGTHVWNYDDTSGKKRFKKGDPIGLAEFARRKQEMQRQGLYDKSYTES